MKQVISKAAAFAVAGILHLQLAAQAQSLDQIGVTLLRATTTNLDGTGIHVGQAEAQLSANAWEVRPADTGHGTNLFTYISGGTSIIGFPNSLGLESTHADYVGELYYGIPDGVATNPTHVDNFKDSSISSLVNNLTQIGDPVVNQSFNSGSQSASQQRQTDTQYDNYSAQYKTLFVSSAANSGSVQPPSTSYNGISVGAYGGASSTGPTIDNGRCKPDITAPASATSFSTPQVSGAAAVLMQAALRGDGGSDTNSAFDLRVIKALLLNGAVKPTDWIHTSSSPLDLRYGAGILNVFNSYQQLTGGKHGYNASNLVADGGDHPPAVVAAQAVSVLNGWDFNTNSSAATPTPLDGVNHYYFNATNSPGGYTCSVTLVWNRQKNQTAINNLNLYLYNCANSNLVACSTSLVDNVEQIFVPKLAPGCYDLQVWKAGVASIVSPSEPYALAFAFMSPTLSLTKSDVSLALSWPAYPDRYVAETSASLTSGSDWSTDSLPAVTFTNGQNVLLLNASGLAQFYRLRQQP